MCSSQAEFNVLLCKWHEKFKGSYVECMPLHQNANIDALALPATPFFLLHDASRKIWIFTKDLYCHDLRPEDVSPLSTVMLWKHRQSGHLKDAFRCTSSDQSAHSICARRRAHRTCVRIPCSRAHLLGARITDSARTLD